MLCRARRCWWSIRRVPAKNVQELIALAKAEARHAELRLVRSRHLRASQHGGLQAAHRHRHRAHPVSRRGAGRDRPAGRRRLHAAAQSLQHRGPREGRQGEESSPPPPKSVWRRGPSCRPSPRPACRASRPPSGSRCSAPPDMPAELVAKIHADVSKVLDLPQIARVLPDQQLRARRSLARGNSAS